MRETSVSESWLEKVRQCAGPDESGWVRVDRLSRTEAEQVLDWLENRSVSSKELMFNPSEGFTVRWRVAAP